MLTSGIDAKLLKLFLPLVLQLSTPILREISAAPLLLCTSPHTYVKRVSQRFKAKLSSPLKKQLMLALTVNANFYLNSCVIVGLHP